MIPVFFDHPPMQCGVYAGKKHHEMLCQDEHGTILGAVLDRTGRVLCKIEGKWNPETRCYEVTVCNEPITECR